MKLTFRNQTQRYQDNQVWFAITGHKVDDPTFWHATVAGGRATFVQSSPGDNQIAVGGVSYVDYYYSFADAPSVEIAEPFTSARVWIAVGDKNPLPLYLRILSPRDLEQPSVSNPSLPNYNVIWDFMEFDYQPQKTSLFCNTSSVDAFGIPLGLQCPNLQPQMVGFSRPRSAIIDAFRALGAPWSSLVIPPTSGPLPLRVVSPGHAMGEIPGVTFPADYLREYVDRCWQTYESQVLTVRYKRQSDAGSAYNGSVTGGQLVFKRQTDPNDQGSWHTIDKPPSKDVFLCQGVFDKRGVGENVEIDGNIKNQIASAINRTILLNPQSDQWCDPASYYRPWSASGGGSGVTNLYAKTLHESSQGGLCYAFAYDDQCDQSSTMHQAAGQTAQTLAAAEITVTVQAF